MKILALESSTLMGSAALIIDNKIVAEKSSIRQKSHSEVLNSYIDDLLGPAKLKLEDIDYFATGKGPGSFTGLRIAGNIIKTLSYSYKKPLVAIDSLTLLAAPCPRNLPILAMINAYKNMVYYGLFHPKNGFPEFITGPDVIPVKSLGDIIKERCLVVGDGFETYQPFFNPQISNYFVRDKNLQDYPIASTLGLLASDQIGRQLTLDWKSYFPLYIRASEAEENKRGIFIPSL